ncbi:ABC transporter permease [Rhodococcus cerastii]|uniref:ABC transporter permease n=1 Tax=Rhodococcus cerastii TaxID=908616 RepID=A0ABU4D3R5_9NOCA|nr:MULTISPECIES: ABC transporter permease [Rhodococcus]KZF07136.1 ABC transporter permease [Rhodococcus sp. EPR-147]MDV6304370.1 ABC transporter permease [Rhodococcus cerastii]OZE30390.1 ABC transporter permease [Rhodococcus sp. 05-2254-6]OZE34028.1 ABC transporter permease [Rhodococcus sp. 05-2254-4]OZE51226.1 ABC transporter permease [Rhodococcus sp. 05-2254-3]
MTILDKNAPPSVEKLASRPTLWQQANKPTLAMLAVTVAVAAIFSVTTSSFLTFTNISNLATQIAPVLIIAVAMTFVITTGQIDLSVGATVAFVAAMSAELIQAGVDSSVVFVAAPLMGAAWGLVNGWLAAYQGIPPFIVTLATLSIIRGIALYRTEGFSVPITPGTAFAKLGTASWLGFSASAWIALGVVIIGAITLNRTRFGRYVTGIGSNVESVRRSGVNTRRVLMMTLVFTGLAAGIAGLLIAARLGSGSANSANGFELTVITAVVLGGTNLFGGRGTVIGTVIGAVLTGIIANGLTLLGVSPFLTPIITGVVLLMAIWINMRGHSLASLFKHLQSAPGKQ